MVESYLLYSLISGDLLFLGMSLLFMGLLSDPRFPLGARAAVWVGVGLVLLAGVPIQPVAYAVLPAASIAWQVSRARSPSARRIASGALLLVAGALVGETSAGRAGAFTIPRSGPTFIVGDSLSAGLETSKEGTWPSILARSLDRSVTNLASAGATLASGRAQLEAITVAPALVFVELGGNDVLGGISAEQYAIDLRALLGAAVARGGPVAMFELPLLPLQNRFGRIQRQACGDHGVMLIPRAVLAGAIALPGNAVDGLHLSAQGHHWLAKRVIELSLKS